MLDKVKQALRISCNDFDQELLLLINAAKADLRLIGIRVDEADPLTMTAIILFCRARFGQPDDYDRVKRAYDDLKSTMQISSKYRR